MVEVALPLPTDAAPEPVVESLTKSSLVVASKELLSCDLGDGAVILDTRSGVYYGLNLVGMRVWSLIQRPNSVFNVWSSLVDEYDVEPDCCLADLEKLFAEMAALNLIEITYETNP